MRKSNSQSYSIVFKTIIGILAKKISYMKSKVVKDKKIAQRSSQTVDLEEFARIRGGSIAEFVNCHIKYLKGNKSLKAKFTKQQPTINIAKKLLQNNKFLLKNIIRSSENESSKQLMSENILVSDISDSNYFAQYQEQKHKKVVAFVGGPAAEDGAVMASLVSDIKNKNDEIVYIIDDYSRSNVSSSAKQLHARHAVPLNAEDCLTGHALASTLIKRAITGITLKKVVDPHYIKVDINPKNLLQNLTIYLKNELDWARKTFWQVAGRLNDNDWGRIESLLTISMLQVTEKITGRKLTEFYDKDNKSHSIHVTFSKKEDQGLQDENKNFERAGIFAQILPREEIKRIFGEDTCIFSAYQYPSDSNILFDAHQTNQEIAVANGVNWMEGVSLKQIFLNKLKGEKISELAGIEIEENGERKFLRVSEMHTTLGYRARYVVKNKDHLDYKTIETQMTTAAGMSMNLILRKTKNIKSLMANFNNTTGQLAVTNSHWTMIAQDDDFVILRITGGGFTGAEEYKASYFLNTFANTIRIFGEDAIEGVLSTYACSRAIDPNNATRWLYPAKGWVISYGKGGTGNSERTAEAAFAALFLGYKKEVITFYNQFKNPQGKNIGDLINEVFEHVCSKKIHFYDISNRVARRIKGYEANFVRYAKKTYSLPFNALKLVLDISSGIGYRVISLARSKNKLPQLLLDVEDSNKVIKVDFTNKAANQNNAEPESLHLPTEKKDSLEEKSSAKISS